MFILSFPKVELLKKKEPVFVGNVLLVNVTIKIRKYIWMNTSISGWAVKKQRIAGEIKEILNIHVSLLLCMYMCTNFIVFFWKLSLDASKRY